MSVRIFGQHDEATVAQIHRCLAVGGARGVLCADGHKGYEMVEEAIEALMRTLIIVRLPDGSRRRVQFLGGNDLDDPGRAGGCSPTALTSA